MFRSRTGRTPTMSQSTPPPNMSTHNDPSDDTDEGGILYINDLQPEVTEADLRVHFGRYGKLRDVELLRLQPWNISRRMAFVEYFRKADAERASKALKRSRLKGHRFRLLLCMYSKRPVEMNEWLRKTSAYISPEMRRYPELYQQEWAKLKELGLDDI